MEEAVVFRNPEEYEIGEIILSDEQINKRIAELAEGIATTYNGKKLLVVGLLKGGFRVTSDLVTQLHDKGLTDVEISFLKTKSYLDTTESQQDPEILQDMDINPQGKHILLVDDIADTGKSLKMVEENLTVRGAKSIASFVLLDKPSRREVDFVPTYIGFTIPNIWVQGRGMDTNERGRADRHIRRGPYYT